jgi:hypothetical protein
MRLLTVFAALLLLAGLTGCRRSTTITSDGKKVEVARDGGKVTVETPEGKAEFSGDADQGRIKIESPEGSFEAGSDVEVSREELGLAIYPRATPVTSSRYDTPQGKAYSVSFKAGDSFERVVAFYKEHMPGATAIEFTGQEGRTASLSQEKGKDNWSVVINEAEDGTALTIVHVVEK